MISGEYCPVRDLPQATLSVEVTMRDSKTPSPDRRWYPFRLRTLLVAVMVLGVPLSWFATKLERARKQRKVVEAIQRLGRSVGYDNQMSSPMWLRNWLGNDFFDEVEKVNILNTQITDTALSR